MPPPRSQHRPPLHDAILRPHERDSRAHPGLARRSELEALADQVQSIGESGAPLATNDVPGLVKIANSGQASGDHVVRANDPRLQGQALADQPGRALGEARAGTSGKAARQDHVHPLPTYDQIPGAPSIARRWMLA